MMMQQLCQFVGNWDGRTLPAGAMVSEKLDGWRMLWIRDWESKPGLWTRNGIPFEGVAHIAHELQAWERHAGEPFMFDGEFVVGDGPNTLAQTKAWAERGWKAGGNAGRFHVFDGMPLRDWQAGGCDLPMWQRKARLARIAEAVAADEAHAWEWAPKSRGSFDGLQPVRLVDHVETWFVDDVLEQAAAIWAAGGEGVVIGDPEAPYRRNRSNAWMKVGRPWRDKLNWKEAA
jgi:ATP-dependent DNA ligase